MASLSSPNMSDNCALETNGNIKDAAHIHWHNDADDDTAMNSASSPNVTCASSLIMGSTASSSVLRDAFSILLGKGKAPATLTASACRSTCTSKLLEKLCV